MVFQFAANFWLVWFGLSVQSEHHANGAVSLQLKRWTVYLTRFDYA